MPTIPALLLVGLCLLAPGLRAAAPHDPELRILELSIQIDRNPTDAALYLQRARSYLQVAEPRLALADYEMAGVLCPDDPAPEIGRASLLWQSGRDHEALASLLRAQALGAAGPDVQWLHGRVLRELAQPRAAAQAFAAAMPAIAAPRPEHYLEFAAALAEEATPEARRAALAVLDDGVARLGQVAGLVLAAVEYEMLDDQVDRAVERLDAIAALVDRQAPWHRHRSALLERAGRAEAAAAQRQLAAELEAGFAAGLGAAPPLPRRAGSSLGIDFDAIARDGVEFAPAPPLVALVRGPYLQNGTDDGVVVRWRTDLPATTRLWVGPDPATLALVVDDATPTTEHSAVVRGLPAERRVFYAVGDAGGVLAGADQDHWFDTLPVPGSVRPVRVWALGDCGTGDIVAQGVRDAYLRFAQQQSPDMLLLLGDNAYPNGTDADYQLGMFDTYPMLLRNTITWSTLGNHDAVSASSPTQSGVYYDVFDHPRGGEAGGLPSGTEAYYSFDRGHVHFVCLDSQDTDRSTGGAMLTWLAADLASTSARWTIAFWHHPPYTKGSHDSDNTGDSGARMFDMRRNALPILEAAGVDLVLSGHSHTYERSFLADSHYGFTWQFSPSSILDSGDGRSDGDGSYAKPSVGLSPHEGAVYVVTGSAGRVTSVGTLDHPVMHISLRDPGSLILDIDGDRLDGTFVNAFDQVADRFTIEKGLTRALTRDVPDIVLSTGGTQQFTLDAGLQHAGRSYLLAGSFGTEPGFDVAGVHVPLQFDFWLTGSVNAANGSLYPGSLGVLDAQGRGAASFVIPAGVPPSVQLGLAGASLWHAFLVFDANGPHMASNPVRVRLLP